MRRAGGFTLLEVMVAILLAMIGLLGTVAIQQTMLNGSTNAQEAAIASRLATQTLEQFGARITRRGDSCATGSGEVDLLLPLVAATNGAWTTARYADAKGRETATYLRGVCSVQTSKACAADEDCGTGEGFCTDNRFRIESRVCVATAAGGCGATAVVGGPYNISVRVTYGLDSGAMKEVRTDAQRQKCW